MKGKLKKIILEVARQSVLHTASEQLDKVSWARVCLPPCSSILRFCSSFQTSRVDPHSDSCNEAAGRVEPADRRGRAAGDEGAQEEASAEIPHLQRVHRTLVLATFLCNRPGP
eukprot:620450-Rhodomonas_salina.2